ncbi:MAG: hypothetical protein V3V13_05900 [Paracoccaceae bacterium]
MDKSEFELKMLIKPVITFLVLWVFFLVMAFIFPELLEGSRFKYPIIFLAYAFPVLFVFSILIVIKRSKSDKNSGSE